MTDINEFRLNQGRVPREELERYNGQYVAWSSDGSRIVAADPDPLRLDDFLRTSGYDPATILVSRMVFPEEASWGGCFLPEEGPTS
jgi:hypothetical protein